MEYKLGSGRIQVGHAPIGAIQIWLSDSDCVGSGQDLSSCFHWMWEVITVVGVLCYFIGISTCTVGRFPFAKFVSRL